MKFNIDKIKVGKRIFNIRNSLNLTLEQFGKIDNLNASKSIVLRWENGTSLPNRARLEVIAKKGNMTVNKLLYGDVREFVSNNFYELLKNASAPGFINDRFTNSNKYDLEYIFFEKYNHGKDTEIDIDHIQESFTGCYYEYLNICNASLHTNLNIINDNIELAQHYYKHIIVGNASRSSYLESFFRPFYKTNETFPFFDEETEEIKNAKSLNFVIKKMKYDKEIRDICIYSQILKDLVFLMNKDEHFRSDEIGIIFNSHKIYILSLDNLIYHINNNTLFWSIGEIYDIPLKLNKYNFLNYENLYGIYIKDIETTYILATYLDMSNTPLNTEAEYFILNHDDTYQITKITEIPDCKYIAPIIGKLE